MPKNKHLNGSLFSKRPLAPSEASVSNAIAEYLDRRRIYNLRLNSGKIIKNDSVIHLCPEGTPDRFACYRGISLFIEVKAFGEKPTQTQLDTHENIRRSGGIAIVAYSVDDVVKVLKDIDRQFEARRVLNEHRESSSEMSVYK